MRHLNRLACAAALAFAAGCSSGGKSSSSSSSSGTSTTTTTVSSASSSSSSTTSSSSSSSGSTTASSSSSTSSSSGSSTATSTSSSSSASSSTGSTGTSSSSTGSSGSSGGTTSGPLTFPEFCAQAQTTACSRLQGCGVLDPTSTNCAEVGTYDVFGCNGDTGARIASGLDTFDDVAGQACLTALAGTGCDAATLTAVSAACTRLRKANVQVGGYCIDDSDCVFPDAGPYAFFNSSATPTCQVTNADVACGGTCIYGVQPGDLCSIWQPGMGCVGGDCVLTAPSDGGSSAWTCIGYVETAGADCTPGTLDCDPSLFYCSTPTDGGGTVGACLPLVADGGACNTYDVSSGLSTPCGANEFCQSVDGGNSTCVPAGKPGDVCDTAQLLPCGAFQGCNPISLVDGGVITACTGIQVNLGGRCSPQLGVNCEGQMTCTDALDGICKLPGLEGDACGASGPGCFWNFICAPGSDGGNVCQSLPTQGQPCNANNACAPLLVCAAGGDGGTVCVSQELIGQSCDLNTYMPCGDGYCAEFTDGGAACMPLIPLGQPCDVNQSNNPCASNGFCSTTWYQSDGGALCTGFCQQPT
ncbi:MAG: hypothetical protein JST54_25290 [Deltaproteobacteria bacterium]|nr:hypothetical protein [Deltaproteobacteria bacterium]